MAIGINLGGDDGDSDLPPPAMQAQHALKHMSLPELNDLARSLVHAQNEKFKEMLDAKRKRQGNVSVRALAEKLDPSHVKWVVNSMGELGVELAGTFIFMSRDPQSATYKGYETVIYREQPDGERLMVRKIAYRDVAFDAQGRNHLTEPEGTWTDLFTEE